MEVVLFIFYIVLFSIIVTKISFFRNSGISKPALITLFLIKVVAGVAYAKFYMLPEYFPTSDTWRFYRLSLTEKKWLLADPLAFIKDLFSYGYNSSGNLFSGKDTFWNDLKSNIPVKLMAVMNIATNDSYYCNIILFNFIFLFGIVGLYRVFYALYPHKKELLIISIFLLPSTLFWCSGIHKDGLILCALGMSVYSFSLILAKRQILKSLITLFICLLLVFALRNYVLFALLPALLIWCLCNIYPHKRIIIFAGINSVGVLLFFTLASISPALNFPAFIANKRAEFLLLEGGSQIRAEPLTSTISGFLSYLPHVLDMAFLQPHPTEIRNLSYLPAIAEVTALNVLIIISIARFNKRQNILPFLLSCFTFSISIMLICGYTIPFAGAIVRYRSIALPLLLTPLLCISDVPFPSLKKYKSN